jgi:hypothetical protein
MAQFNITITEELLHGLFLSSLCQVQVGNFFVFPESILICRKVFVSLNAQPSCGCTPKKASSLPPPRQGQAPWGGLTASLDMEPRASRFDWPGAATLRLRFVCYCS